MLLVIVGMAGRLNVLVGDFGQNFGYEISSGLWRSLGQVLIGAILLTGMYQGRHQRLLMYGGLLLALIDGFSGLISFSKVDTVMPILSFFMGIAIRKRSSLYVISVTIFSVFLLSLLGNLVLYARANSIEGMSLSSRFDVLEASISRGLANDLEDYSSWYRFSYTVAQGAAIEFYQRGNGGDDLKLIPYTFVPRMLFPSKPNMSLAGSDFYTKFTGEVGSSEGMGVFINGYYNWGWLGVIFVSILCGWILAQVASMLREIVSSGTYILYPIVFFGIYMGFSVGGTLILDYLGIFNILMVIIFILYIFNSRSKKLI